MVRAGGAAPAHGRQQNVVGSISSSTPVGSPPLGWHIPAVYVKGPALLLASPEPGGTWPHVGPPFTAVSVTSGSGDEQALSLKIEIAPVHVLPLGASHAHGVQVRPSW